MEPSGVEYSYSLITDPFMVKLECSRSSNEHISAKASQGQDIQLEKNKCIHFHPSQSSSETSHVPIDIHT